MRTICLGRRNPNCKATHHGTRPAYQHRCRCPHAIEAYRLYQKRQREGRLPNALIDNIGTARRLQALAAIGWTFNQLGTRLAMHPHNLPKLVTRPVVHHTTAAKVATLYRELAGIPGPSAEARKRAAAKGWLSPIFWDRIDDPDEQPVALLVTAGETLEQRRRRHADRYTQFLALRAAGHGQSAIRQQLKINHVVYHELIARADNDLAEAA